MMKLTQLPEQGQAKDIPSLAGQTGLFLRWKANKVTDDAGKPKLGLDGKQETTPVRKMYCHVPTVESAEMLGAVASNAKLGEVVTKYLNQQWLDFARESIEVKAEESSWEAALSSEYALGFGSFIDWITTPTEASGTGGRAGALSSGNLKLWFDNVVTEPLASQLLTNWGKDLESLTDAETVKLQKIVDTFAASLLPIASQRKHKSEGWKQVPTDKQEVQFTKLLDIEGIAGDETTELIRTKLATIKADVAELVAGLDDAL